MYLQNISLLRLQYQMKARNNAKAFLNCYPSIQLKNGIRYEDDRYWRKISILYHYCNFSKSPRPKLSNFSIKMFSTRTMTILEEDDEDGKNMNDLIIQSTYQNKSNNEKDYNNGVILFKAKNQKSYNIDSVLTETTKIYRPRLEGLRAKLQGTSNNHPNNSEDMLSFQQAKEMTLNAKSTGSNSKRISQKVSKTELKDLLTSLREQDKHQHQLQKQRNPNLSKDDSTSSESNSMAISTINSSTATNTAISYMLTDKYKRFHTYLRISLSERCNFRCLYCMPPEGVPLQQKEHLLTSEETIKIATLFSQAGVDKIRLTGGEPLLNNQLSTIIASISSLPTIRSIGITTNGLTLSRQLPKLLSAGLTHVNISLDTLHEDKFKEITRRNGFRKVMQAIDDAAASSIGTMTSTTNNGSTDDNHPTTTATTTKQYFNEQNSIQSTGRVKINCVVMKGFNDNELRDFVYLTKDKNIDVRFIEWMPFNDNGWNQDRFLSYEDMLKRIQTDDDDDNQNLTDKKSNGNFLKENRIGPMQLTRIQDGANDTTKWHYVPGFKGRIGFITSMSEHFCGTCNRLRITADGKLKVCLFGAKEVSLRDVLRMEDSTDEDLVRVVNATVKNKTWALGGYGDAEGIAKANSNRPMTLIGG